jgi:hypothetical protein
MAAMAAILFPNVAKIDGRPSRHVPKKPTKFRNDPTTFFVSTETRFLQNGHRQPFFLTDPTEFQ